MEYHTPIFPMAETSKIIRKSVYTFLQSYQFFTSTAVLLAFPFSASVLLSQAFSPSSSSLMPTIYNRLRALFDAAGFPPSSEFFSLLNIKLSQTIFSSIFALPFTLTFLLITKATIIQALKQNKPALLTPSFSSVVLNLYSPLLLTHICNSILILSANATVFALLCFAFIWVEGFGFSSPNCLLLMSAVGAVLYSIVLANTLLVCNLALVVSGMEQSCGGWMAILKASIFIRGRTSTALSLALPLNTTLAAVEALFHYRVVRTYHFAEKIGSFIALEGMFIVYLYSIIIVLETILNCMFINNCKMDSWIVQKGRQYSYWPVEYREEDNEVYVSSRTIEELP